MSEISKNIVSLIVSKEFHKAKTLIHEAMNNELGILLEEKLSEYAPTLYEGEDTEYSSAFDGERYNKQGEYSEWLKKVGAIKRDENEITPKPTSVVTQTDKKNQSSAKSRLDTINSYVPLVWNSSLAAGLIQATPEAFKDTAVGLANMGVNRGIPTSYAVGKVGMNTAEVAAKATSLIPQPIQKVISSGLGITSKLWKPAMIGADIIDVANTSIQDTDWKDKPGTAAATLGVDIAKHAAKTAPWLLPSFPQIAAAKLGQYVGTTIAQGVNIGIDAIAGTNLADLQKEDDTYDPKKIVQSVKAVVSSKKDIEKETQSEMDEFKKEVESSGRGQAMRDADAEGAKITAQFDADQKKKQEFRNLQF
jgi:hypothetical protein